MDKIIGGWNLPEVAAAQHALVIRELAEHATDPVGPYAAFRWAMDTIGLEYASLLDVGCGSGHYGVLCERFYPYVHYHGTDISDPMTVYARQLAPLSTFSVCEFHDNRFGDYDIVLASQVMEMTSDPPEALDFMLSRIRKWAILNRIRLTKVESYQITEGTYCGNMGHNWLWNLDDIIQKIERRAKIVAISAELPGDQIAIVARRE